MTSSSPPLLFVEQIEIDGVKKVPKNTVYVSNGAKMQVEVQFNDKSSTNPKDAWLGFYAQGSKDNQYMYYQKCEPNKMEYLFSLPRKPGLYQVRYFPTKEYNSTSLSKIIRSGPILKFEAKLDESDDTKFLVGWNQIFGLVDITSGYIGVFNEENVLDNYVNIDRSEGKTSLKRPLLGGNYHIRLIWEDTILVESQIFPIQGADSIHLEYKHDKIHARVKIMSFDPFWGLSWIALYKAGEKDSRKYLEYHTIRSIVAEFVFSKSMDTEYEVRVYPKYGSTVPTLVGKLNIASLPML